MLFDDGIVAFRIFSTHQQMATFDHSPPMLFKPHAFASLEAIEFPTRFLFLLVFSGMLEFPLRVLQGLNGPCRLVFLLACGFEITLCVLVDAGIQFEENLRPVRFAVLVRKDGGQGSFSGGNAYDPWYGFDGFLAGRARGR